MLPVPGVPSPAISNLSVIVPFHRNLDQLRSCLAGLGRAAAALHGPTTEVIVVADGAVVDPADVVREAGATLVSIDGPRGPAVARNHGARQAVGDLLVFVDTDVIVAGDALDRFAALFTAEPDLAAAFGAYDEQPADPGFVSQCRNLSHSCVHQFGHREAHTFWAGLGAIRRSVFEAVGGFDERFGRPSVEDIDLGYRVRRHGGRIVLDSDIRGTHLKRWSFWSSLVSDIRDRGIPWTQLLGRYEAPKNDLNVSAKYRLCVVLAYLIAMTLVGALVWPRLLWALVPLSAALWWIDRRYYRFFIDRRGLGFALRWFPLHIVHHLTNGVSFMLGTAIRTCRHWTGVALPGALPLTTWGPNGEVGSDPAPRRGQRGRLAGSLPLIAVCALAAWFGARGITDEGAVTMHGDMQKYLMNGVYMMDALHDRPFGGVDEFLQYTRHYFARYPALSLGHHPPLVSAFEVPAFALFGPSVWVARAMQVLWFVAAVAGLFCLTRALVGPSAAGLAAGLFVTSPMVVRLGQSVMSEMPALALAIWSAFFLLRFCQTERRSALVAFTVAAALSLYAKQLTVFVFPAYAVMAVSYLGLRRLLRRDVVLAGLALGVAVAPLVPMTLMLSPANVSGTLVALQRSERSLLQPIMPALDDQFAGPVLIALAFGLARTVTVRRFSSWFFLTWTAAAAAGLILVGHYEPARHGIYWVPSLCVIAAIGATAWGNRTLRLVATAAVLALVVHQATVAARVAPPGGHGYEQAARFVVASEAAPTVMFSGDVDTGFFTFFVRKHDPSRSIVVLRSDKILTTSFLRQVSVEDRISDPAEIYTTLERMGTRFVVIEDRPSASRVLEWLRTELKTHRFAERLRVPIESTDFRLRGVDVVVYEFLAATPADASAGLSMNIPLVDSSVDVRLIDLIERKYLR